MKLEDFQKNLETAVEQTIEDLKPTMEEAALTAKALLARRIQNTGFGRRYRSRGYKSLRASKGYEIRFVNLTFSGKMFQNWKRPGNYRRGFVIGGTVGGTDVTTINKLKWNKSRYPTFDKVIEDEKELITQNLLKPRIIELIKKNMFR
ncbi:hypothetical protein [Winogradskyella forsetii]|uniref:hypothetical protein n=1 Tax=Winogradskyella forsetii TaxID=2686077 RepID=UPI0015C19E92|nr:hypothetical protein [Winogradskyella forsetii]